MTRERVQEALDEVRPMLQMDGGDAELVNVTEDGKVYVRMQGACGGCPGATMTIKWSIEKHLKEKIPEVSEVIQAY